MNRIALYLYVFFLLSSTQSILVAEAAQPQIKAAASSSFYIDSNETLWGWGKLLLPDTVWTSEPVSILHNVKAVTEGANCFFALKSNGDLWVWGYGDEKILGEEIATKDNGSLHPPTKILSNVQAVSCTYNVCFAIKNDDTLWTWGEVWPDGLTFNTAPKKIADNVDQVSVSNDDHMLVLMKDGRLFLWGLNWGYLLWETYKSSGCNNFRQLLDTEIVQEATTNSSSNAFSYISANNLNDIAVTRDGRVWSVVVPRSVAVDTKTMTVPVKEVPGISGIHSAACGSSGCLYLKKDKTLWINGDSAYYPKIATSDHTEDDFQLIFTDIDAVSISQNIKPGMAHVLILKSDGSIWTWGDNKAGVLGTAPQVDKRHHYDQNTTPEGLEREKGLTPRQIAIPNGEGSRRKSSS